MGGITIPRGGMGEMTTPKGDIGEWRQAGGTTVYREESNQTVFMFTARLNLMKMTYMGQAVQSCWMLLKLFSHD